MLSICSSSCGKRPTWQTLPCSYKEAIGSARTALPREAVMVLTGTFGPAVLMTFSTMAPPKFRSATIRSARNSDAVPGLFICRLGAKFGDIKIEQRLRNLARLDRLGTPRTHESPRFVQQRAG